MERRKDRHRNVYLTYPNMLSKSCIYSRKSTWACVHKSREQTQNNSKSREKSARVSWRIFLHDKQRWLKRPVSRPRTAVATMSSWSFYLTLALAVGNAAAARLKVDLRS